MCRLSCPQWEAALSPQSEGRSREEPVVRDGEYAGIFERRLNNWTTNQLAEEDVTRPFAKLRICNPRRGRAAGSGADYPLLCYSDLVTSRGSISFPQLRDEMNYNVFVVPSLEML